MNESDQSVQPEPKVIQLVPSKCLGEYRDMTTGIVVHRWAAGSVYWTCTWRMTLQAQAGRRTLNLPPLMVDNLILDVTDELMDGKVAEIDQMKVAEVMQRALFVCGQIGEQAKSNAVRQALAGR